MEITKLTIRKLDNSKGELDLAKQKFASPQFILSDDIWIATFDADGVRRQAAIKCGRRVDVAPGTVQLEFELRVNEDEFDEDIFIPESEAADILKVLSQELEKLGFWQSP